MNAVLIILGVLVMFSPVYLEDNTLPWPLDVAATIFGYLLAMYGVWIDYGCS